MKKLGVGIIGCGAVAAEYIKAFQKDPRSEIRALVSRNSANAQKYRDLYSLKCTIETDASKMLEQNDIDIVVVCTPHNTHTQYVVAAAQAHKHIIIEKPVALTPQDLEKQRRVVLRQTRDSYRGVINGISQVRALKQATISSKSAMETTQAGFEVGTRTIVDVLLAQRNLFRAQRDYLQAQHDYILNILRLKQAAGTLSPDDLKHFNQWLG